jgi:hypothetical protein
MLAANGGIRQAHVVVGAPPDRDSLAREPDVERRAVGEIENELAPRGPDLDFFFARKRCAHPGEGRYSGGTRTSTTEMLSRPPFWFAMSIKSAAARARSVRFSVTIFWMISGSTMSVRPSELSR